MSRQNYAERRRKKALARTPTSSKQQGKKSGESSGDEDLAFSESLFFKRKPGTKAGKEAPGTSKQPSVNRRKNKETNGQSSGSTEYFAFLNESQKRDHEFFERLAEKEAERELKSHQMMFSMVKEVAKIFKGD